jgi:hypothetical protein
VVPTRRSAHLRARRTGTGLTVTAGRFLILDPLYSALDERAVHDLMRARVTHCHTYSDPILAAVTNGRFSLAAESLALENRVRLFDSARLPTLGRVLVELSDGAAR